MLTLFEISTTGIGLCRNLMLNELKLPASALASSFLVLVFFVCLFLLGGVGFVSFWFGFFGISVSS